MLTTNVGAERTVDRGPPATTHRPAAPSPRPPGAPAAPPPTTQYYASEKAFFAGDAPKGVIALSPQVLLTVAGERALTLHALPLPLIVKTEQPVEVDPLTVALSLLLQ